MRVGRDHSLARFNDSGVEPAFSPRAIGNSCGYTDGFQTKGCAMKADVVQEAESADKRLEQAGKSTMRLGAILFLAGAGMMALISLASASESQTRDIGSSICLAAVILGVLRFLRGYREYQQGGRLAARRRPPG